jgi:hypothetical protein
MKLRAILLKGKQDKLNHKWIQQLLCSKEEITCIHRRMISGRQHLRQRPRTIYVAGPSKVPSALVYQASNLDISIVTPAWNRASSPTLDKFKSN